MATNPNQQSGSSPPTTTFTATFHDEVLTVGDLAVILKCKESSIYNLTRRHGRTRYDTLCQSCGYQGDCESIHRIKQRAFSSTERPDNRVGCALQPSTVRPSHPEGDAAAAMLQMKFPDSSKCSTNFGLHEAGAHAQEEEERDDSDDSVDS